MNIEDATVLVLGADGFIGRHIAYGLRNNGWNVIACARRPSRLQHMGFETIEVDLTSPEASDPNSWYPYVEEVTHVVNAAGVLNAPDAVAEAVHVTAPEAVYSALPVGARGVLISAVGIDDSDTAFARYRREGEAVAARHLKTILRPSLVLGETSYGGSSLARSLAGFPLFMPVIGNGEQKFNPIHASDLAITVAQLLEFPPPPGPHEIGGSETVTQTEMLRTIRGWLGHRPVPRIKVPMWLASLIGRIGDAMRLGPISATAVAQLRHSLVAKPSPTITNLPVKPFGFSEFVGARPAGTQDLWQSRLYLTRPLLRMTLAVMWLVSGLIGIFLSPSEYLPLVADSGMPGWLLAGLARACGAANLLIAIALLRGMRPKLMALIQAGMVAGYTIGFTLLAPALWLLPLGGLLKNIPILALIGLTAILEDER